MANNEKATSEASKKLRNIGQSISSNMDALYRSTYMTATTQSRDLRDLTDRINDNIDQIVARNNDTHGMPSVSSLYSRIARNTPKDQKSSEFINGLESMFDNGMVTDDLYDLFMSNRYLRELDNEIDTICKYMPDLEEALMVMKDCVLSADHFSKDFLSLTTSSSGEQAIVFSERIKDLKKRYKLLPLVEEIYENMSKYGEQFIYRVPYKMAIGKLLSTKPDTSLVMPHRGLHESTGDENHNVNETFMLSMDNKTCRILGHDEHEYLNESATIVTEAVVGDNISCDSGITTPKQIGILGDKETFHIALEICRSGIIESAISEYRAINEKKTKYTNESMMHAFTEASKKDIEAKGNIEFTKSKSDDRILTNDGLIGGTKPEPINVDVAGCVVKKLRRDHVYPIYIDDICMGYYYFELRQTDEADAFMGFKNILGDVTTNMRNSGNDGRTPFNAVDSQRQDNTIKYVAAQLSKFIDKQFVNANQDIAKEIYMILKYNDLFNTPSIDAIKVTFIPPEDIVHFFFRQDPITHRGISDLEKAMVPAKVYTSLYITSAIGNLTRGYDKRVYYVKQTVDTNIAKNLLTTISQIKQSNFGIRQFQNINHILNITGRFNDLVIPTNASGDPPIQFEIMPGQNIEVPTELMEELKSSAVNSTGIPIEIIQARQSIDYAMQLTMSSSKVLRLCYKRQELYEELLAMLITPIYNYQYDENISISVELPPPTFINVTNTNQLVDNTKNLVQSFADVDLAGVNDDALKQRYMKELFKHYIGSHMDISRHQEILERCKIELSKDNPESHSDNAGSENSGDDYY